MALSSSFVIAVIVPPKTIAYSISFGKYFTTQRIGFGAACPRPQIDASAIATESSSSSPWFHRVLSIRAKAFAVPTRHGVHCPHDSSEKNFMTLRRRCRLVLTRQDHNRG